MPVWPEVLEWVPLGLTQKVADAVGVDATRARRRKAAAVLARMARLWTVPPRGRLLTETVALDFSPGRDVHILTRRSGIQHAKDRHRLVMNRRARGANLLVGLVIVGTGITEVTMRVFGTNGNPPTSYVFRFLPGKGRRFLTLQSMPIVGARHEVQMDSNGKIDAVWMHQAIISRETLDKMVAAKSNGEKILLFE